MNRTVGEMSSNALNGETVEHIAKKVIFVSTVNKHKPWIETSYHGVITENTDVVLLDPPLVALDKDAPVPYAGMEHGG